MPTPPRVFPVPPVPKKNEEILAWTKRFSVAMEEHLRSITEPGGEVYAVTNRTIDRTYDADTVLVPELADVVGTLILDLQTRGLLS